MSKSGQFGAHALSAATDRQNRSQSAWAEQWASRPGSLRRRLSQTGSPQPVQNVGGNERMVSLASGAILALLGAGRRDLTGLLIAGIGAGLVYRGATGHCSVYQSLGIDNAQGDAPGVGAHLSGDGTNRRVIGHSIHISQWLLIDKLPQELYAYWRNFENLPRIMTHLESVQVLDEKRSHWVAKAPSIAGGKVEWDAEITADEPNARIAWCSLPSADVANQGEVQFARALGDRGTMVRVIVDYYPPAGRLGKWVAKLFGEEPEQQIWSDLRNFKCVMEVGEVPSVADQPHGSCAGRSYRPGQ